MGDDLRNLRRLHAMVERKLQVIRQRDRLIAPDKRGERDDAAIAPRKTDASTSPSRRSCVYLSRAGATI